VYMTLTSSRLWRAIERYIDTNQCCSDNPNALE